MKKILLIILTVFAISMYGQEKSNHISFDKLTDVEGTDFVIAGIDNIGELERVKSSYLFINTKNGKTVQVDLPNEGRFQKIEQVKIDNLGINCLLVSAQTIDLDGKKGIDWNDPSQIIILSTDGGQKTKLTDNKFFVRTWVINRQTGYLVVTGQYDTNNNGRQDRIDKNEIEIYDLKTLKLKSKI